MMMKIARASLMTNKQLILGIGGVVTSVTFIVAAFTALVITVEFDENFDRSPKIHQYDYMPTDYTPVEDSFYF